MHTKTPDRTGVFCCFERDSAEQRFDLRNGRLGAFAADRDRAFRAVAADEALSDILAIPLGSPVLRVSILCFGYDDEPLLTDTFYFSAAQSLRFNV